MNHRDFMRSLSGTEKRRLTTKTNTHGILRLATQLALLTVLSICIAIRVPLWLLILPVQGILIVSLFHLLHECIHDTPFRTRTLNKVIGTACGFILFLPGEWFRYFHRDHHRYTQIEGKDPELASAKPSTKSQWLLHISGLTVYKSLAVVMVKYAFNHRESFIPESAQKPVVKEVRIMWLGYAAIFCACLIANNTLLLWLWIVPLLLGQPFLRLYLLAEHTLCDYSDDMLRNTRTVLSNPIVRWFTWNMPYHTEHHVYPAVPFHQLPNLNKRLAQYLAHTNTGYTEFNTELYRTLE